ncbi:single-stranded DNA-binding protein [Marinigracilibium pacificum]|uniref:Single-stranded DNA-binding protein n=1 Tax=Marinigracilibium pacificum TaxID=2729599 RepID=A0A848IWS7_9BACT|nr:single-stranded DNA-binding protein [Marinigracilibium pacificum]NMM48777.1 single-stranded DNA-binding protein [Marinigracilibium pacificum]
MNSIRNRVQLIGNLGTDPEMKEFDSGNKMTTLSLATSESYLNAKGERVNDTQWHRIVLWGKLAEIAGKYLSKGREVVIEGKLIHRSYEDQQGNKRFISEVVAQDLLMLNGAKKEAVADLD